MIEAIVKATGEQIYVREPYRDEYYSFAPDYIQVNKDGTTPDFNGHYKEYMADELFIKWNPDNAPGVDDLIKSIELRIVKLDEMILETKELEVAQFLNGKVEAFKEVIKLIKNETI